MLKLALPEPRRLGISGQSRKLSRLKTSRCQDFISSPQAMSSDQVPNFAFG